MSKELRKMPEMQRMNRATMLTYSLLTFILLFAYLLEFFKGDRLLGYTIIFAIFNLVPYVLCVSAYMKNKTSRIIKYVMSVGFSVLYAFVLLTAAVPTTFVYIFLIFFMIIPYGDLILCYITGGIAVLANIISVIVGFTTGALTTEDLAMI